MLYQGLLFCFSGILLLSGAGGCAYYNYFYNAKKHYDDAEKQRKEQSAQNANRRRRGGSSSYDKCIESAGRMLEYYPGSKWESEALLLLAKSFYHTGKYRQSINKADELTAKYPESQFSEEAQLWKGISLLKVAQPDSARHILAKLSTPETPVVIRAQAYYSLGEYYHEQERWGAAIEQYKEILGMDEVDEWTSGQALMRVGECLKKLSRHQEAYDLYTDILAKKPTRQLRFEATFQRAAVQRELGRWDEALAVFIKLLDDAAFTDDFPRIELEAARCEFASGKGEDAVKRLERLIEAERRGEIAAQGQYELGLISWGINRDFKKAISALKSVKQAERSSDLVESADSMMSEIESLSRYWYRLRFLESQIAALDSAILGLADLTPEDTTYIDSVKIVLDESNRSGRRNRGNRRGGRNDPLRRMVEEAMEAEADQDSLQVSEPDTTAPLDSLSIAELLISRKDDRRETWYELSQYHLFERRDSDSAKFYSSRLLTELDEGDIWGRTLASLAYIEKTAGNEAAYDSLYRLILTRSTDDLFQLQVQRALGLTQETEIPDTVEIILKLAETTWMEMRDSIRARDLYLEAAGLADSTSDIRASALFAAGYLSLRVIGDLPSARELYGMVVDEFSREPHGRAARDIVKLLPRDTTSTPQADTLLLKEEDAGIELEDGVFPLGIDIGTTPGPSWEEDMVIEVDDKIYTVDEIDEPPQLSTSLKVMENLIRSYYPPEASEEGINGEVELEFVVDERGKASQVKTVSEEPEEYYFGDAAQKVLRRLRYQSGRYRGQKVKVKIKQRFTFEKTEP